MYSSKFIRQDQRRVNNRGHVYSATKKMGDEGKTPESLLTRLTSDFKASNPLGVVHVINVGANEGQTDGSDVRCRWSYVDP